MVPFSIIFVGEFCVTIYNRDLYRVFRTGSGSVDQELRSDAWF